MHKFILNKSVIDFLSDNIGGRIKSLEIGGSEKEFSRSYGKMRINFELGNMDIYNLEKPITYMGDADEMSGFECYINVEGDFNPYLDEDVHIIQINNNIKKISIVQDKIYVNEEIMVFDEAIIFEGETTLMIARGWQYDEIIHICNHLCYDAINPISKVIEEWNNFGEYKVLVERTTKVLK